MTERHPSTVGGATVAHLLARLDALPDLLLIAQAKGHGNPHPEQERLVDEYYEAQRPYRMPTIYQTPPSPCSTREHMVRRVNMLLVSWSGGVGTMVRVSEEEIHECRVHGAALRPEVRTFLENLAG